MTIKASRRAWMIAAGCAALLMVASTGHAEDAASIAGDYVHSQMELVAGIRLNGDGTFLYGLTVGSLDEKAKGRWTRVGDRVDLVSDPKPVAPTIAAGRIDPVAGEPFGIRVLAPNGRDVPGVDFLIEFDSGEPLNGYTPGDRWTVPADERRMPRFITFAMPSYRLRSARLPLDARAGQTAVFLFTPNDFGVVNLTGAVLDIEGETLTLHREDGSLRFKRVKRSSDEEEGAKDAGR